MNVVEIIGNQYLRNLALEETIGRLQVENSLLQEKVMKLTPLAPTSCPLVGCKIVGEHSHEVKGPGEPTANLTGTDL